MIGLGLGIAGTAPLLGPELITNGHFTTDVGGWESISSNTIAHSTEGDGEAILTRGASGGEAVAGFSLTGLVPGEYEASFKIADTTGATGANVAIYFSSTNIVQSTAVGTYSGTVTVTGTTGSVVLRIRGGTNGVERTARVDNVSFRRKRG